MISIKTDNDIRRMRKAGLLTWSAHKLVADTVRVGMTTAELDAEVEKLFVRNYAIPLFKGVKGRVPYPACTCVSINDQVVHGIPGARVIKDGDLVSVDTGCKIEGWCGDSANTYPVGNVDAESRKLVRVTREVLQLAINLVGTKKYWSEVAREMEQVVTRNGFSVVETFVGHGIGREMHEEPQVPNFVYREFLRYGDFELRPGVVIAIEPMVNAGTKRVRQGKDYWTMLTADGRNSAHVEHTVGLMKSGPVVLTGGPETSEEEALVADFFDKYRNAG
ncbi:MAG: type I methionyl aminopeptidase [Planctomycetia bacterium]|nr:type I methionyl aminopeptidase [Planctomycetia bacterium]